MCLTTGELKRVDLGCDRSTIGHEIVITRWNIPEEITSILISFGNTAKLNKHHAGLVNRFTALLQDHSTFYGAGVLGQNGLTN